jgi:hypothetical protein
VDAKPALAGRAVSGGRLNADAAVAALTGQGPTAVPTPEPIATPTPTPTAAPPAPVTPPVATPTPVAPVPTATPGPYIFDVTVGGSLTSKRSKLRVRYSLSAATNVRFTISRRGSKRPLASWVRRSRAGANTAVITRRLPTGQLLRRGRYTLEVGLSATAKSSRSLRVR